MTETERWQMEARQCIRMYVCQHPDLDSDILDDIMVDLTSRWGGLDKLRREYIDDYYRLFVYKMEAAVFQTKFFDEQMQGDPHD